MRTWTVDLCSHVKENPVPLQHSPRRGSISSHKLADDAVEKAEPVDDSNWDDALRAAVAAPEAGSVPQPSLFLEEREDAVVEIDDRSERTAARAGRLRGLSASAEAGGRALVYPVYKGMYERHVPFSFAPHEWRDMIVMWSKDLSRTVDYLEERPDIDAEKLAYYGFSAGAVYGPIFTAVDDRFKASVLLAGGLFAQKNWTRSRDALLRARDLSPTNARTLRALDLADEAVKRLGG